MNDHTVSHYLLFICLLEDSELLEDKDDVFFDFNYSAKARACLEYLLNKMSSTRMNALPDGSRMTMLLTFSRCRVTRESGKMKTRVLASSILTGPIGGLRASLWPHSVGPVRE